MSWLLGKPPLYIEETFPELSSVLSLSPCPFSTLCLLSALSGSFLFPLTGLHLSRGKTPHRQARAISSLFCVCVTNKLLILLAYSSIFLICDVEAQTPSLSCYRQGLDHWTTPPAKTEVESFDGGGEQTQDFMHAEQGLCHRAILPAPGFYFSYPILDTAPWTSAPPTKSYIL